MAHSINSTDEAQTILSSDRAFSVCSSERPLTVQSSAPPTSSPTSTSIQYAAPGIAIPVTDSPVESAPNTTEHVESSCEAVYSLDGSSSEDIELLEAQAMAARAMLRLAEAKNKKKSSSASARSGRSSNPQQVAQSSNAAHLPQNIIANRVTEIDHRPPQVELPVTSTGRTVMGQSTSRPPTVAEDPNRWWRPVWAPLTHRSQGSRSSALWDLITTAFSTPRPVNTLSEIVSLIDPEISRRRPTPWSISPRFVAIP